MSKNNDSSINTSELELSENASAYILLQRIDTQRWNPSNLLPEHKRPFDGLYRNFLMELESDVRHEEICRQYLEQMKTEFEELKPFLPEHVDTVLDIGCGMAGIDIFLHDHYRDPNIVLFDKSEVSDELYYQFYESPAFYNSLETARENLAHNGVADERVETVEADQETLREQSGIDLCLSLYSWGFHYPVKTYLDGVIGALNPDGRVVLDIRKETGDVTKGTEGYRACEETFEEVDVVKDERKFRRIMLSKPVAAHPGADQSSSKITEQKPTARAAV